MVVADIPDRRKLAHGKLPTAMTSAQNRDAARRVICIGSIDRREIARLITALQFPSAAVWAIRSSVDRLNRLALTTRILEDLRCAFVSNVYVAGRVDALAHRLREALEGSDAMSLRKCENGDSFCTGIGYV